MPDDLRAACQLLPAGVAAPPRGFFTGSGGASKKKSKASSPDGTAGAAAAFFTAAHLQALLPVLRLTSGAHPRLHSLWPTLLALLLPGFSADRVRWAPCILYTAVLLGTSECNSAHPRTVTAIKRPVKKVSNVQVTVCKPPSFV